MRRTLTLTLALAVAGAASSLAQPTLEIADVGGGVFDIEVSDLNGGTRWTTAGLHGTTSYFETSAAFVYHGDPNSEIHLTQDSRRGNGRTDITFVSLPAAEDDPLRFDRVNAPNIAGRYRGGTGAPIANAMEVDVAWFDSPGGPTYQTGFIARVVLDVRTTGFAPEDIFAAAGSAPANTTLLASGVVTATTDVFTDADAAEISWSVYAIPEPGGLALLFLGGLGCCRRR